jgi:hypothetical protein
MRDQLMPNEGPAEHERWLTPGTAAVNPTYETAQPAGMPGSDKMSAIGEEGDEELPSSDKLFAIAKAADELSKQSDLSKRRAAQTRSWRAFHNEHAEGSRYRHENFGNRSKLFVPKTHSSVIKNAVAFASALFSTNDVVSITAEHESDPAQRASADVIKADLNIRLDRNSHKSGIPWFWISMAACIESQVAGVTFSKQYWEYEFLNDVFEVAADPNNPDPVVVGMDGEPVQKITKKRVLRDRFVVEPHAAENVIVDMAAPFWDVVQGGAFLIVKIPMHVGDVKTMMKPGRMHMGGGEWFKVTDDVLAGLARDYTNTAVRSARDKGTDRYSTQNNVRLNDMQIVWVHENFVRYNGRDYQFWSLGTQRLLSEPVETITAYPAHHGDRPFVMGVGAIEPHNALPMAPVELWRPLQDATNEVTNLGIDTIRQSISPIKKVVRGKKVDLKQLRRMGPDATVLVTDKDDVTFEVQPNNAEAAFVQLDRFAVMQDELAGDFSTSAVQSNRNLNETVGGMKMLAGSASGKTEYDLRIIIETWAEPVIRQCVWLIQYYESDERILAIAGDKAKLFQKYQGADPLEMDLLANEVTVRVNVGIGAADPMQRLQKFITGMKSLQELAASGAFGGQVEANAKAIFDELLGLCGYPEAERFFTFIDPETAKANAPPSEGELAAQKTQADIENQQAQTENQRADLEIKKQTLQHTQTKDLADLALQHRAANATQGQAEQSGQLARDQFTHQVGQDQQAGQLAQDQFQHTKQTASQSHALALGGHQLAVAGQNKQIMDEQDAALAEGEQPPADQSGAAPQPPSVLGAMSEMLTGLARMMHEQQQTMMQAMMQQQSSILHSMQQRDEAQDARMAALLQTLTAPKQVTYGPDGRVAGLQVAGR